MSTAAGSDDRPAISWKASVALLILGAPMLRALGGRRALNYLHAQILLDPKPLTFLLLTHLGRKIDPVLALHIFDVLLRVPDHLFEDRWIQVALLPLEDIPGITIRERISTCQKVLLNTLGLWKTIGESARASFDMKQFKRRTFTEPSAGVNAE